MTTGAVWEEVSGPMTGLAGPTRMEVGRIGSTVDTPGREGMSWLSATISPPQSLHALGGNTTTQNPAYSSDRAIRFYDDAGDGNDITAYRQVTLSTVWNRESLKDFSDNGLANRFNYGYGEAVEHLVNTGSAKDFSPHRNMGKDMDSVDLKSFVPNAKAFDAVLKFFADKEKVLAEWMKQLGDDDAAWRGTSADAFRELIDGIHTGYKNLVSELSAAPGAPATLMAYVSPAYTPTSAVGRMLIEAANEIHRAADELCTAWRTWRDHPGGGHLQTHHLDYWLDEVSVYLNENNITKTVDRSVSRIAGWGQGFGLETIVRRGKLPGFSVTHPVFGDLRNPEAWQKLGEAAYKSWVAGTGNAAGPIGLTELDKTAGQVAIRLYNSLNALANATPSAYAFTTGFTNLRARFDVREAERKAADAQREAERQKEEMEKKLGGGGQPPPGLGPGGAGSKDGGLGIGGPGAPEPPPGLDLNGPGPGTGVGGPGTGIGGPGTGIGGPGTGVGGPGGLKPPPGLDPNGPGGGDKNVIRNPDGSVSVRNPDGSYTTTRPDGSKVTTPPGVLPPGLGLNPPPPPPGLKPPPGLGLNPPPGTPGNPGNNPPSPPLKTVKGPDGSTTSYNQDGSRTITHKDGATTTVGRDGTVTTTNPGASTTVLNRDGSQSVTYADGSRTTFKPDGSSVTQYKNGTTVSRAPDGTLTTTDPEGNKTVSLPEPGETVRNPDGSTTTYHKGGSTTTVHPDGTRTTVGNDGTVTTIDPDGTKTVARLGQSTSTIEYADGSVAKVEKDGTVVTTYKDGASTRLGPDGTYTTTDAEGKKTTEHLNPLGGKAGAITTHNADGSTSTRYPDGTVDQEFKDGRRKISYADGRVITTDADGRTISVAGGTSAPPPPGLGSSGSGRFSDSDLSGNRWVPKSWQGPSGGQQPPSLNLNSTGNSLVPPPPPGAGGSLAGNGTGAAKATPNQSLGEVGRRPATMSTPGPGMMPPMMPPMGGMGGMGGGGQGGQSDERERQTWISEDEEVWGTDEGGVAGVIGR